MILPAMLGIGLTPVSNAVAADKDNCLMCHKYPSLAIVGKDGLVRNFNINEHVFLNSLHGQVGCRECHTFGSFPMTQSRKK